MAFVDWRPAFSVGHMTIDEQHRALLDIVNRMHRVLEGGGQAAELNGVVEELTTYTLHHFAYEEHVMEQCGFPGIEEHKRKHRAMMARVQAFRDEAAKGGAAVPLKLMAFLKDWLTKHILSTDMEYSGFLARRRVA